MTPKQKAKELFEKFYYANQPSTFELNQAKQCALIAIDEIIASKPIINSLKYWEKVKQELEKL